MSNLEEIQLAICSSLPGLPDEMLKKLLHGLTAIGVETKADLHFVNEEDLVEYLRPIQCRKLLNAWKNKGNLFALQVDRKKIPLFTNVHLKKEKSNVPCSNFTFFVCWLFVLEQAGCSTPQQSSHQDLSDISSPGSESSSNSTPSRSSACSSASCVWAETFKVPWEVMPSGIRLAIANKKRPSPADRRQLVRILVGNMQKHEVNPSKAQCQIIVQNIVKQYPESFADVLADGTKIGCGYASLLLQVKTRVEHVNRNNTLARRRKERLQSSCRTISQSSRRPADRYGCVSWQPEELPAGENDETLEEKRKQMVLLHSTEGMSGATRGELHKLMEVTYYRQRRDINASPAPPLSELKNSWPYLFSLKGIFLHFNLLTDISLLQKIMESIEGKGKRILRFFQEKPTNNEVRAVLSKYQEGNSLVLCILQLLMAHFKERTESLLIEADVSNILICFMS